VAIALPESLKAVLAGHAYGHVLTYNPSGTPQLTMVWMDVDGDQPTFNTALGRIKPRNLENDARIVVSVQDPDSPQAYALLYGTATVTEEGADAQIDDLANRFLGLENYPFRREGETRLMVRIDVDKIGGAGPGMKPWS
jgi:PPOX class probable F420-dependent enzyme